MEQKTSSAIDPALVPSRVSIEVVSSGSAQLAPCLIVKTPLKIYLFNVPEGTTRYIKSFHVREVMVNDIFFTRALWSNFGGLIGFLLNRGPTNITRLHGPPNLKLFVEKIRSDVTGELDFFHDDSSENKGENLDAADVVASKTPISELDEFSYKRQRFEDPAMLISYIPVFEMSTHMDNDGKNSNKETNSGTLVDVAFLLQLKV
uniref:ribonuclease Z n=1 Tax=Acrobeloides nanus TaxID=290746 RepID=A0A914E1M4_9BILA